MTFPSIKFKFTNTESNEQLQFLTEQKLQPLSKYIGDAPALCEVEYEKLNHQNSGDVYRIEVNLDVNGKFFRAEAALDSFEKAVDEVQSELDKELRRANTKKETLLRKGGRKIKEMLRFGR